MLGKTNLYYSNKNQWLSWVKSGKGVSSKLTGGTVLGLCKYSIFWLRWWLHECINYHYSSTCVILWFIRNICLVIQMTEIYSSYIFGLHPWFLAHSSQNSWNLLSDRNNGSTFYYNIWSLVLSSWNRFRAIKVKWVSCHS